MLCRFCLIISQESALTLDPSLPARGHSLGFFCVFGIKQPHDPFPPDFEVCASPDPSDVEETHKPSETEMPQCVGSVSDSEKLVWGRCTDDAGGSLQLITPTSAVAEDSASFGSARRSVGEH